jgi:hypothetical protein
MRKLLWIPTLFWAATAAHAEPDFSRLEASHGIPVCPDSKQAQTFYYLPNDLAIRKGPQGKPEIRFVMMRYTGTAAAGDQGKVRHRNILQFDVAMTARQADSLARAKSDLQRAHPRLSFIPLPIRHVDAVVHYASIGDTSSTSLGRADLESSGRNAQPVSGSYWQERTFTLSVDNLTADMFAQTLRKGMLTLSVGYAFHSRGKTEGSAVIDRTAGQSPRFRKMMDELFAAADSDSIAREAVVHVGAFAVEIDSSDYDRCVKQIDLNEAVPPGYSVLSIYDYDFNNTLRPELFEKMIEIEAVGAGGGKVQASAEFRFDQPEIYRKSVRFRYAVQLSQPYRYRVREIDQSGEETVSSWVSVRDWTPILDVTTRNGGTR